MDRERKRRCEGEEWREGGRTERERGKIRQAGVEKNRWRFIPSLRVFLVCFCWRAASATHGQPRERVFACVMVVVWEYE